MWARESGQTPVASCVWFGIVYTTTPILKTSYDYIGRKTQEKKKKYILFGAASTQIFEFFIFQQEIVLRPFFFIISVICFTDISSSKSQSQNCRAGIYRIVVKALSDPDM